MGQGLQRICKMYGRMEIQGVMYYWDYVNDEAVTAKEMPIGSKRWKASELARMEQIKHMEQPANTGEKP